MSRATIWANFYCTCFTSVTSITFTGSVFHATTMETAHIFASWNRAIDTCEHFATLACTILFFAFTVFCFGVTVIFTGFFNTTNASELLSVESWVYINQVTYTCGVNAHTISVTVVWAILFSTIATTVTCVTFTFTVSHATSMESTFFIACSYATVWSSPSFFTLA